jgi:hypothetical protein
MKLKKYYIPILLENFKEVTNDIMLHGRSHENCIDINCTKLQPIQLVHRIPIYWISVR